MLAVIPTRTWRQQMIPVVDRAAIIRLEISRGKIMRSWKRFCIKMARPPSSRPSKKLTGERP
jgi:hypothetical protein